MTDLAARLRERVIAALGPAPPDPLGVAVSGGSDSLGLLALLSDWRAAGGPELRAVTVDHKLRPEAAEEAGQVARLCRDWGIPHATLDWTGWDGTGNLPDQARRARYRLMAEWAAAHRIACITLAHTLDDQAETFLMRLGRAAGVDGLAAMAPHWHQGGVRFARPALELRREELREVLRQRGLSWVEDPSNADPAYDRVRARQALKALAPLGIEATALATVARNLADVRDTLYTYVARAAREFARLDGGDVVFDRAGLAALPPEIARRLLQEALMWIGGADYPPRGAAMARLLGSIEAGRGLTLHGCRLIVRPDTLRLTREEQAVAGHRVPAGAVWDGRWRLTGPDMDGATVAALGEAGLKCCPDRRKIARPAASLRVSPAVWREKTLVAAPLAGMENGWRADLVVRENHDFAALLSH